MHTVYANEQPPESYTSAIFLAGPTPRSNPDTGIFTAESWRSYALTHLESIGYDGVVFIPEDRDGNFEHGYIAQVEWEETCLNLADVIIFWVPRNLSLVILNPEEPNDKTLAMPAFTTNAEYGMWVTRDPARVVLGAPENAPKMSYLEHYAKKHNIPYSKTLKETCGAAITKIGDVSFTRRGGERNVPLHIWRTPAFQSWYNALKAAGNRLDNARVEWVFRTGPTEQLVFMWILHVDVYIESENRNKVIEVVMARPDISSILLYEKNEYLRKTRIVLVKEFRSPVANKTGFVYELAGGSSWDPNQNPLDIAVEECDEEVGLRLSPERFVKHQTRQLAATLLSHQAHLFSVELSTEEMDKLESEQDTVRGVEEDSERTTVSIQTYGEILDQEEVDWAMFGMICSVLDGII